MVHVNYPLHYIQYFSYSVLEIARILIKKIKNTTDYDKWIKYIPDRQVNDQRYYISNQKLKYLGWDIKVKFIEGLDKLIEGSY